MKYKNFPELYLNILIKTWNACGDFYGIELLDIMRDEADRIIFHDPKLVHKLKEARAIQGITLWRE